MEADTELGKTKPGIKHMSIMKSDVITALSQLISSNTDIGIKHTLSIAYDQDPVLRGVFLQIMTNVLNYGSSNPFSNNRVDPTEKYADLIDALLEEPYFILQGLGEVCGFKEIDEIVPTYLDIFAQRGRLINIISYFAKIEISKTEDPACTFRSNSISSKLLSEFAKTEAKEFIQCSIGSAFQQILSSSTPKKYEIDPAKIDPSQQIEENFTNLSNLLKLFFGEILKCIGKFPKSLIKLNSSISNIVKQKFPGKERLAIGGFVFLRLCCPAIVTPEQFGLVKKTITDSSLRRGLLLVSKIIQNLANNVLFGQKEACMTGLNPFLKANRSYLDNFLDEISIISENFDYVEEAKIPSNDLGITEAKLHNLICRFWIKLEGFGAELSTAGNVKLFASDMLTHANVQFQSSTPNAALWVSWKQAMEKLSTILNSLGPPPDVNLMLKALNNLKPSRKDTKKNMTMQAMSSNCIVY